jgi:hypothetical protein
LATLSDTSGEVTTPSFSAGARVSASGRWDGAELAPRNFLGSAMNTLTLHAQLEAGAAATCAKKNDQTSKFT